MIYAGFNFVKVFDSYNVPIRLIPFPLLRWLVDSDRGQGAWMCDGWVCSWKINGILMFIFFSFVSENRETFNYLNYV